jgi:hypothetical protein
MCDEPGMERSQTCPTSRVRCFTEPYRKRRDTSKSVIEPELWDIHQRVTVIIVILRPIGPRPFNNPQDKLLSEPEISITHILTLRLKHSIASIRLIRLFIQAISIQVSLQLGLRLQIQEHYRTRLSRP